MIAEKMISQIEREINGLSLIDVHTHLDAGHLSARGLEDILLYHMVISDLYSAGCPDGLRLPAEPDKKLVFTRISRAIDYLPRIENTSCYWLMTKILEDLYGWTEPLNNSNWQQLDEIIREKSKNPLWPREILKRAKIETAVTELPLRRDGQYDDILQYSLEWVFLTRNQWFMSDGPIYELEHAWQYDVPQSPLAVTITEKQPVQRQIKTIDDAKKAMKHYCRAIPFDKIVSTAHHISTDISYSDVDDEQMQHALDNRENAGDYERDVYASWLFELFLKNIKQMHKGRKIFQFSFGAEPLPRETDSRLNQNTVKQLAQIIARHPEIEFHCYLSAKHANQVMCTLCRELPNLLMAGYWWHNFFPSNIMQIMDERLDMLAINKQIGFFSDAYCVEWSYAKSFLVKYCLSSSLAKRVGRGQFDVNKAVEIARKMFFEFPCKLFEK